MGNAGNKCLAASAWWSIGVASPSAVGPVAVSTCVIRRGRSSSHVSLRWTWSPVPDVVRVVAERASGSEGELIIPAEGGTHRLADAFEAVDGTNSSQHMRGVGTLLAPRLEQRVRAEVFPHQIAHPLLPSATAERGAELGEHRGIEAGIVQGKRQGVFPVDAGTDGLSSLAVGAALDILQHTNQRETPGGHDRATTGGE